MDNNKPVFASLEASTASHSENVPISYGPGRTNGNIYALEKELLRKTLDLIDFLPVCFVLWDGQEVAPSTLPPVARVLVGRQVVAREPAGELVGTQRFEVAGRGEVTDLPFPSPH